MNAREKRIALRRATIQTLIAVAASGGRFYDGIGVTFGETDSLTLAAHVAGWQTSIAAAVCATYAEACEAAAFAIEADDGSGRMLGYRLIRLGAGPAKTGHLYSGETFRDADTLWTAMRTLADMREHPACKVDASPERPRSIVVIGRRHFTGGNTYCTAEIVIDGVSVHCTPRAPGYDEHYQCEAAEWLESQGIVTRERHAASGGVQSLSRACEAAGIRYTATACDVARKKDLT